MPTIGGFSCRPPMEPRKGASPKLKMPPSDATSQYPLPSGVAAMPTMGALSGLPPMDPRKLASPKLKTPPSDATSQYPIPSSVAAMPTAGRSRVLAAATPTGTMANRPTVKDVTKTQTQRMAQLSQEEQDSSRFRIPGLRLACVGTIRGSLRSVRTDSLGSADRFEDPLVILEKYADPGRSSVSGAPGGPCC